MMQPVRMLAAEAVSPITDGEACAVPEFLSPVQAVNALNQEGPICVIYPDQIESISRTFVNSFAGTTLYAVKANPHPVALQAIWRGGVRNFDVASVAEIDLIADLFPSARLFFMHPVKSARAIRCAYERGVRDWAFDDAAELDKIIAETGGVDVHLHLRVKAVSGHARYDLSGKFGARADDALVLLRRARTAAARVGITFHVGSQCMNPAAHVSMIAYARELASTACIHLDSLDIGGGFPVPYPGMEPLDIEAYLQDINAALLDVTSPEAEVFAEPGRRLVATGGSTLIRVEKRKGNILYVNDGVYGSMFDAGPPKWRFPVKPLEDGPVGHIVPMTEFSFYGPTCDDLDFMEGPFVLPENVAEGDWIEVCNLGAYGQALAGQFNGFTSDLTVVVRGA